MQIAGEWFVHTHVLCAAGDVSLTQSERSGAPRNFGGKLTLAHSSEEGFALGAESGAFLGFIQNEIAVRAFDPEIANGLENGKARSHNWPLMSRLFVRKDSAMSGVWDGSRDTDATRHSLVRRAVARDPVALDKLIRLYGPYLLDKCQYELRFAQQDAEDVVQETLVKVLQSLPRLEVRLQPGAFRSWLRTVLKSTALDWRRRNGRHVPQGGGWYRESQRHRTNARSGF
ncbi:MAG: RNA polymerase sigma factor [Planctomycetales bacterium]|nr:RNA polymerase sigma factor [Planctomycetales bacterium]